MPRCEISAGSWKATTLRELEPWDIGYYAEKEREALYEFDEEALRPYFELDKVVAGMLSLYRACMGST